MGSKCRWTIFGSLVSAAGIALAVIGTSPSTRAAELPDEPLASRQVGCASVDPGFAYELKDVLRGLNDPGFVPGGDGSGTPTIGGLRDPGFGHPAGNCPIGPLEDILASPAADIFGAGLTPTATPTQD
jgi:hypothetical protein